MKRWRANASAACWAMGVDRSTYYRWKRKVDRWGLEALRVRERRRPRMPNEIGPIWSSGSSPSASANPAMAHGGSRPNCGARSGAGSASTNTASGACLCRVGLNTRAKRLALIARHHDRYERKPEIATRAPHRRPAAGRQGPARLLLRWAAVRHQRGRTVWQYTAIGVASAYAWAQLRTSHRNPRARHTDRKSTRLNSSHSSISYAVF